jgi:hypothetical protein
VVKIFVATKQGLNAHVPNARDKTVVFFYLKIISTTVHRRKRFLVVAAVCIATAYICR